MNDLVWLRKEVDDLRGLREHTSHLDEEAFNSGKWKAYTKVIDLIDLIQKNPITVASVKAEVLRLITELVSNGDDISIFEQGRISAFEDILTFIEHPIEELVNNGEKKIFQKMNNQVEQIRAEIERRMKCFKNERNTITKASDNNLSLGARIAMCEEILSFINSLQEEPELEGIEREVAEGTVIRIDRKRIPIELKGEIKAKFKNEFNTMWQIVGEIQFANVAKYIIERICLHFAAWGAYNLKDYVGMSDKEKAKMDLLQKELKN